MGINLNYLPIAGQNSMKSTLNKLPKTNVMLVHNTYSEKEDIEWAMEQFNLPGPKANLFFCFCPNANLYIENKLPDFNLFAQAGARCCVGTDSLASNHRLSVLDELKVISKAAPQISFQTLLTWASLNGAEFLGFESKLGSIEKGKKPGLNLISDFDTGKLRLKPESKLKKLC
jgi:cytosine/adenosine deaminase-related metal-dependent hydrolase